MEKIYTARQFADMIGVHLKTLQRWDRLGVFKARRTPTNHRYYTEEDYQHYLKGVRSNAAVHQDQTGSQ